MNTTPGGNDGSHDRDPSRVLLVEDHPLMLRSVQTIIEDYEGLAVGAIADTADAAIRRLNDEPIDMAIIDISLGERSGLDLIREMLALKPDLRILVFSMHDESVYAERALRAGALGYVNKARSMDELLSAIEKVRRGEPSVSSSVGERLVRQLLQSTRGSPTGVQSLTDRELQVFQMIGKGMNRASIADSLSVSAKTIDAHRQHIKEKLRLDNGAELSRYAALWVQENA
ncbi:MAG: response regulator [Candidatus Eisenbacteria bacterium]|nr:response regulator [Candidatus Latescibacterota bacterium]MBD3300902.1 response regulator [Candidatus Eisenbacteria bacterium]